VTNKLGSGKKRNLIRENGEESKAKVVIKSFKGTSWRKSGIGEKVGWQGTILFAPQTTFHLCFAKKDFHC
jgi:hypothetical protein